MFPLSKIGIAAVLVLSSIVWLYYYGDMQLNSKEIAVVVVFFTVIVFIVETILRVLFKKSARTDDQT